MHDKITFRCHSDIFSFTLSHCPQLMPCLTNCSIQAKICIKHHHNYTALQYTLCFNTLYVHLTLCYSVYICTMHWYKFCASAFKI